MDFSFDARDVIVYVVLFGVNGALGWLVFRLRKEYDERRAGRLVIHRMSHTVEAVLNISILSVPESRQEECLKIERKLLRRLRGERDDTADG